MTDLEDRISRLSPERAHLLELLERAKAERTSTGAATGDDPAHILEDRYFSLEPGVFAAREDVVALYDAITAQLDASEFAELSWFLNWGYASNERPQRSRMEIPSRYVNRNAIRLVLELIGEFELQPDHAVLDVGCGRGGTIRVIREFFQVSNAVGVDLSPNAASYCRRKHGRADTAFLVGDAQALPLPGASFDVVTNIESSHSYPDIERFYGEVHRVLRPGGRFFYTDLFAVKRIDDCRQALIDCGFEFERDDDISSNVLLSCDETSASHVKAFDEGNNAKVMRNFLGVPNSSVYNALKAGDCKYLLLRLGKPARTLFE